MNVLDELFKLKIVELRNQIGAKLVTCYLENRISKFTWNLFFDGEFSFPYTLYGPIYGRETKKRFDVDFEADQYLKGFEDSNFQVSKKYYPNLGEEFRRLSFYRASFAERENVGSLLRVSIKVDDPINFPEVQKIHLFFNYEDKLDKIKLSESISRIRDTLFGIRPILYQLCERTYLLKKESVFLQGILDRFQEGVENYYEEASKGDRASNREHIFADLAGLIRQNLKPKGGDNLYCAVFEVGVDGKLAPVGASIGEDNECDFDEIKNAETSISQYAAESGSVIYINDIREYESCKYIDKPSFVEVIKDKKANAQLVCPVLIGSKVAAVISIECSGCNPFSNNDIILLSRISHMVASSMRQLSMYESIVKSTEHGEKISSSIKEDDIYKETKVFLEREGYKIEFLDPITQKHKEIFGLSNEGKTPPRKLGFTAQVASLGVPLAIGDFKKRKGHIVFKLYKGKFSNSIFKRWEMLEENQPLSMLNTDIQAFAEDNLYAISDLAFPVFGPDKSVVCVIWFKCRRRLHTILNYESSFLSSVAKSIGIELARRQSAVSIQEKSNLEKIQRTYGSTAKGSGTDLSRLAPTHSTDVVRADCYCSFVGEIFSSTSGSGELTEKASARLKGYLSKFITESNGAFFPLLGGEFISQFNIFKTGIPSGNESIFRGRDQSNKNDWSKSLKDSIDCLVAIASFLLSDELNEILDEELKSHLQNCPSLNRTLRCVLTQGTASVGNFSGQDGIFEHDSFSDKPVQSIFRSTLSSNDIDIILNDYKIELYNVKNCAFFELDDKGLSAANGFINSDSSSWIVLEIQQLGTVIPATIKASNNGRVEIYRLKCKTRGGLSPLLIHILR